jgi:phage shock protein PspC (stress-responsive transcriptional regulator)
MKIEHIMKKSFSINISGVVFHIDEDAYDKLFRYLEAIKSHFRGFEGKEEVIADIESRIAEILQKKISDSKQVIVMEDVDEVIGIMGQPADYVLDEEPGTAAGPQSSAYQSKRLYRDPDQKIIGGVCSGIASYFMIDPLWIRLIFIILTFSGFGIMLYLILWVVVPEARTTAEKLEMRGQQVNINNIEQSLKDEVHHLKSKINDLTNKAKGSYRKGKENFNRDHREHVSGSFSAAGRLLLRILLITIGFFIFLVGLFLSLSFLAIIFKLPFLNFLYYNDIGPIPLYPALDMIFSNDADLRTFITAIFAVLGIPLLLMLWAGIRLIFSLPPVKYLGRSAFVFWICCAAIALIYGMKTYNSFRYQGEFVVEETLLTQEIDTMRVITPYNLPANLNWGRSGFYYFPEGRLVLSDEEKTIYGIPRLKIYPSPDSTSRLVTVLRARGPFRDDAEEIAAGIRYDWKLSGDTLTLPDSFIISDGENWRKQEMELKLYLPQGTIFSLDENCRRILKGNSKFARSDVAGKTCIMDAKGGVLILGSSL